MRSKFLAIAGAILTVAVFAGTSVAVEVPNGDMEEGFITGDSDTMPLGWGSTAVKNGVYMGYEMTDVHGGVGAMKLHDPDNTFANGVWVGGLDGVGTNMGETLPFHGYYKLDQAGLLQIGLVRFCGGGGYCELKPGHYKTALRESGTTTDWTEFSYDITLPDIAECEATCTDIITPHISIHMSFTGPGVALLDDLAIGTTPIKMNGPVGFSVPYVADDQKVTFAGITDYTMKILTADGKLVRTESGSAKTVEYFKTNPTAGTYVVQIKSAKGNVSRTIAVSGN